MTVQCTALSALHEDNLQACFKPFVMFNVDCGKQQGGRSGSFQNWEEVKLLITMLNFIYDKCKPEDVGSVAIISPYSAQVRVNTLVQMLLVLKPVILNHCAYA